MNSIKNAVRVAIMQVGVIVIGVLGAGLWIKMMNHAGGQLHSATIFLATHAFNFLVIPLGWIIFISFLNQRPAVSDGVRTLALLSGVLLLIGLVALVVDADLGPFLSVTYSLSGEGEH